jgi:hypothetical protein
MRGFKLVLYTCAYITHSSLQEIAMRQQPSKPPLAGFVNESRQIPRAAKCCSYVDREDAWFACATPFAATAMCSSASTAVSPEYVS